MDDDLVKISWIYSAVEKDSRINRIHLRLKAPGGYYLGDDGRAGSGDL